jgi:hypothetical protein
MFDNWWKNFDPLNYETVKKNIQEFNDKSMNFWKDFYNDVFKFVKRDEK